MFFPFMEHMQGTPHQWGRSNGHHILGNHGGAKGSRTPGLLIANEALSQLSYSPTMYDLGHHARLELSRCGQTAPDLASREEDCYM